MCTIHARVHVRMRVREHVRAHVRHCVCAHLCVHTCAESVPIDFQINEQTLSMHSDEGVFLALGNLFFRI